MTLEKIVSLPEVRFIAEYKKVSFYALNISGCSLHVLFRYIARSVLEPATLASWEQECGTRTSTVLDQSDRTKRGPAYLHVLIALTIFQQPYEKIHSQPNFYCIASRSVNGRPPPHPFDNDFATSYRTSAIFSHRQVDTLPNNSKWPRSRECEPNSGEGRPWASI